MSHRDVGQQGDARPGHNDGSVALLELIDIEREYVQGSQHVGALRGVSLRVSEGELVAVMGPSGSGKSTLLAIAGGLDRPTRGEVRFDGHVLGSLDRMQLAAVRRRHVGFVFQDYNLLSALTAAENVGLPLELDGYRPRLVRRHAHDALERVGLGQMSRRFPEEMSGGERQRVAIARALVGHRRLLLADEPTGALDSATGTEILRLVRGLVDAGAAGILVTHDATAAAWADRIVALADGLVVAVGPAAGVRRNVL